RVAPGFRAAAWAPDGVVEAVEATGSGFALGVQFHPEGMAEGDPGCRALFGALVEAARLFSRARATGTAGVCRK
ncbi:MAG: gamma-glutamyl-gamma-aminobutyrate hydrolase family protein, partial [Firmicutes bacterium]|nr:gamma-glutamyl-gamma-aminobutyrate hydrolase family protein [Bacillota bacterium]